MQGMRPLMSSCWQTRLTTQCCVVRCIFIQCVSSWSFRRRLQGFSLIERLHRKRLWKWGSRGYTEWGFQFQQNLSQLSALPFFCPPFAHLFSSGSRKGGHVHSMLGLLCFCLQLYDCTTQLDRTAPHRIAFALPYHPRRNLGEKGNNLGPLFLYGCNSYVFTSYRTIL